MNCSVFCIRFLDLSSLIWHLWLPMQGLKLSTSCRAHIGMKLVGQLDPKPFLNACLQRPSEGDAGLRAGELCSEWQHQIKNSNWHPIKVVEVDGKEPVQIFTSLLPFSLKYLLLY